MNTEQRQAYGWAKTHDYPSIAARYARALASAVDDLQAQLLESQRREWAAVEFIKYLDRNYSGYMAEDERFAEWRGLQEAGKGVNDGEK